MAIHNFKLSEYLTTHYSFILFDILFKDEFKTKEAVLDSLDIASSTYRRARIKEQKIGSHIVLKLNNYFHINDVNKDKIEEYEILIANVVSKIYYKVNDDYNSDLEKLDEYYKENTILSPIFKMIELFISINSIKSNYKAKISYYRSDYEKIKKYEKLFNDDLKAIYFIIESFFVHSSMVDYNYIEALLDKINYAKGLFYSLASTRYYLDNDFYNALLYARYAEKSFIIDYNINRLFQVKCNICSLYLIIEKNQLAYKTIMEIAEAMFSYKINGYLYLSFKSLYYASLFLTRRHLEIINTSRIVEGDIVDHLFCAFVYASNSNYICLSNEIKAIEEINGYNNIKKIVNMLKGYYSNTVDYSKMVEAIKKIDSLLLKNIFMKIIKNRY